MLLILTWESRESNPFQSQNVPTLFNPFHAANHWPSSHKPSPCFRVNVDGEGIKKFVKHRPISHIRSYGGDRCLPVIKNYKTHIVYGEPTRGIEPLYKQFIITKW